MWLGVFFFQAEDGIRDGRVTGVQTCALPISSLATHSALCCARAAESQNRSSVAISASPSRLTRPAQCLSKLEIGRASRRERVRLPGVAGWLQGRGAGGRAAAREAKRATAQDG